ncbi:MAG: ABC transporter permease [Alphaproteobacteria bacterium]|nr:ABC transporter permease [Alphaproteobacteria bacterium]
MLVRRSATVNASFGFVGIALFCLIFADLEVTTLDPWTELGRMAWGFATPDFLAVDQLADALLQTVAFAVLGVAAGSVFGFVLAPVFQHFGPVRWVCAFIRAIHELFWALIFIQMFGPSPLAGILAIAIPYTGICAKVYAEILEEADLRALKTLPPGAGRISTFFYAKLPDVWVHLKDYTFYRLECGLRSSAVLGFVGLPTLGFYLESFFKQGHYSEVSALLILFFVLIATIRLWMRPRIAWVYVAASPFAIAAGAGTTTFEWVNVQRFFTEDIVPAPLRNAEILDPGAWLNFGDWTWALLSHQALPGIVATILLTQIALVGTGILALAFFPMISDRFFGRAGRTVGHVFLVIARSTPEYVLAYIFLQLWGPSMLPAIVALSLHNGAIIGHLIGRHVNELERRPDAPKGVNLYAYEVVPRVYGQFLAFLFYRWEVIMRETAILGILGIHTLGFHIDSAIADIRIDRAMLLIVITALLNIAIDICSRNLRRRLRLRSTPDAA